MTDFLLFENAMNEYKKLSINDIEKCKRKESSDLSDEDNLILYNKNYSDDEDFENESTYDISINDLKDNIECIHKNISNENSIVLCIDCGKELEKSIFQDKEWRYYGQSDNKRSSDPNRVHIRKIDDRSIYKDVENMGFSEKIISIANQLYIQVTKGQIFRGNSRKAIVFACVFHSFKLQGKPQTHENLIKIFGLSRKTSLKGLKHVNLNVPKD
jgi:transcription initiation factor TFIIIB Brf1 subunit/transcription initiation factor TFIIB